MGIGEIIDGTSRLLRVHWRTFLVLYAILDVPTYLLAAASADRFAIELGRAVGPAGIGGGDPIDAAEVRALAPTLAVLVGVSLLASLAATLGGAAIALVIRDATSGRPPRKRASYAAMLRRAPALVGQFILSTALTAGVVVIGGTLLGLLSASSGGQPLQAGGGPTTLAALVVIVGMVVAILAVQVRLTVASQAVVLEDRGPLDGVRRSWRLTAGRAWRVFGITFLFAIATVVLSNLVTELGIVIGTGIGGEGSSAEVLIGLAIGAAGSSLVGIILPVALTVLFADLRARRDPVPAGVAASAAFGGDPRDR